jgi:hypothetical protein
MNDTILFRLWKTVFISDWNKFKLTYAPTTMSTNICLGAVYIYISIYIYIHIMVPDKTFLSSSRTKLTPRQIWANFCPELGLLSKRGTVRLTWKSNTPSDSHFASSSFMICLQQCSCLTWFYTICEEVEGYTGWRGIKLSWGDLLYSVRSEINVWS